MSDNIKTVLIIIMAIILVASLSTVFYFYYGSTSLVPDFLPALQVGEDVIDVATSLKIPDFNVNISPLPQISAPDVGANIPDFPSGELMKEINIGTNLSGKVDYNLE